jgi:cytosine/adenosine deaminase-related metal-dependent hydrolase
MTVAPADSVIHRAAWVMPMSAAPLANGAVLVADGLIQDVWTFAAMHQRAPAGCRVVDHGAAALTPALVNAHTHLELTLLEGRIPLPQDGFSAWLQALLPQRAALTAEFLRHGLRAGASRLLQSGCWLYGDITNGATVGDSAMPGASRRHTFLEVLGFDGEDLGAAVPPGMDLSPNAAATQNCSFSLAAHACYSTSAALIRQAKGWCSQRGLPFSIHVAEHEDELQFLQDGTGPCRAVLEGLGRWVAGWQAPRLSPVQYLDHLGVLDQHTLLVHAVHLSAADWQLAAQRGCPVCFCPRSNLQLNVGRADLASAMRHGMVAALGTDSLASNTDLQLFAEAAHVLAHTPAVAPDAVLRMATLGGARALQRGHQLGSIEPAKAAALLAVTLPPRIRPGDLSATVIAQGHKGEWQWASQPQAH